MKKNQRDPFRCRLSISLVNYRLTSHATTGKAPCELLLGRRFRSRLDFLRPNTTHKIEEQLEKHKRGDDRKSRLRQFSEYGLGINVSYSVTSENGRVRKCHVDQLSDRDMEVSSTRVVTPDDTNVPSFPQTVSVENSHPFDILSRFRVP